MARATLPKITWGTSYANTLSIGYPLDQASTWSEPREGSEQAVAPSGEVDAWTVGTDEYLAGSVRWIPTSTTADPVATGWDGATGFSAFLAWARDMNAFRFYPDATSGTYFDAVLVEPLKGEPGLEEDGCRTLRIKIRSTADSPFTGY
jgi:hypothetical protein